MAAVIFPLVLLIDLIGVNSQSIQPQFSKCFPGRVANCRGFETGYQCVSRLPPIIPFLNWQARAGIGTVSAINPLQLAAFSEYLALSAGYKARAILSQSHPWTRITWLFQYRQPDRCQGVRTAECQICHCQLSHRKFGVDRKLEQWERTCLQEHGGEAARMD